MSRHYGSSRTKVFCNVSHLSHVILRHLPLPFRPDFEFGFQPGRGYATMDPLLDPIRDHPRFRAVMEKSLADLEAMRRRIETEEIAAGER